MMFSVFCNVLDSVHMIFHIFSGYNHRFQPGGHGSLTVDD